MAGAPGANSPDDLLAALEAAFESDEEGAAPPSKRPRGTAAAEPPAGPADPGDDGPQDQGQQTQQETQHHHSSALTALSEPIMLRVLSFLSPEDLLVLSMTCRHLRAADADANLWRRLYYARWQDGPQQEDAEHVQGATWKLLYRERDERAVLEARQSAPSEDLLHIYMQMATARRCEALRDADSLFRSPAAANNRSQQLSSKVDAFRRQRNLNDAAQHAAHSCRGGCVWHQLEDAAFICAASGYVHVCDSNCAFREPDHTGVVCPISGRCFATMLNEQEERAGEEEQGQDPGGGHAEADEDWGGDDGISGRLGRAFFAGYFAADESDFYRRFGHRLS